MSDEFVYKVVAASKDIKKLNPNLFAKETNLIYEEYKGNYHYCDIPPNDYIMMEFKGSRRSSHD